MKLNTGRLIALFVMSGVMQANVHDNVNQDDLNDEAAVVLRE